MCGIILFAKYYRAYMLPLYKYHSFDQPFPQAYALKTLRVGKHVTLLELTRITRTVFTGSCH